MKRVPWVIRPAAVVLVVLSLRLTAAPEPFALRFGAAGAVSIPLDGAAADVLMLGQQLGAQPGYDVNDVPLPPAPPGQGVPRLFFVTPDAITPECWHDLRPLAANQAWELCVTGLLPGASLTVSWRLESGGLGGAPLRLIDRQTGMVLVADMLTTTSTVLTRDEQTLLVTYGAGNQPPATRTDVAFMLAAEGSAEVPVATLLANDYDPDAGQALSVTDVGLPAPVGAPSDKAGANAYGTTALDAVNGRALYALPALLPADWTGAVSFSYTVRDNALPTAGESAGTVTMTAAPHVVQAPLQERLQAAPGTLLELAYTLRHSGDLESLLVELPMPLVGSGEAIGFWPALGGYADDAAATPDPAVDLGHGPDGIAGSADDTGLVRLDFGSRVPPSGTVLRIQVQVAATAPREERIPALARYTLSLDPATELSQQLAAVVVRRPAYTMTFVAGPGGTLVGAALQTVEHGSATSPVLAVADPGYTFLGWSDGSTLNPRSLADVQGDSTLTALFAVAQPAAPEGPFELVFTDPATPDARRLWDFTGHYTTTLGAYTLTFALVHDERGTLTGAGNLTGPMPSGTLLDLPVTVRGRVQGRADRLAATLTLAGRQATGSAAGTLKLTLTETGLAGAFTVSIRHDTGGTDSARGACTLALPTDMDGAVLITVTLTLGPQRAVRGSGTLTLANGRLITLVVKGRQGTDQTVLLATGDAGEDPAFRAVRLRLDVVTLVNAVATVNSLSGSALGQAPRWP